MKVHDDVKMKNNCIFLKMCRYTLVYSVLVTVGYLTVKYALTSSYRKCNISLSKCI